MVGDDIIYTTIKGWSSSCNAKTRTAGRVRHDADGTGATRYTLLPVVLLGAHAVNAMVAMGAMVDKLYLKTL